MYLNQFIPYQGWGNHSSLSSTNTLSKSNLHNNSSNKQFKIGDTQWEALKQPIAMADFGSSNPHFYNSPSKKHLENTQELVPS